MSRRAAPTVLLGGGGQQAHDLDLKSGFGRQPKVLPSTRILESPFASSAIDWLHVPIFLPLLNDPVRPVHVRCGFTHGAVRFVYGTVSIDDMQGFLIIAGGDAQGIVDDGDLAWVNGSFTD